MNRIALTILLGITFGLNLSLLDYNNPSASHILDAEVIDDLLIVSGMIGGIEFYDISNPEVLNHLSNHNLPGGGGNGSRPNCVKAFGDYAYFTSNQGVAIVNISNPSNPQNLGYIPGTNNLILENLDIYNNLLACYKTLVTHEFFPKKELKLVRAWIRDLKNLPTKFQSHQSKRLGL